MYVEHGKYKITPFGIRFLSLALKKKFSYRKIAEKLGISAETLSYRCREYNISSRKDIPGRKKKYPFLENYFENIDCPEKAYWLGFLSADGYIDESRNIIQISLQERDKRHLEKFKQYLDCDKPLQYKKSNQSYSIILYSKKMVEDLKKLEVYNCKSFSCKVPEEKIPSDLQKYWILGYLDGDGTISIYGEKNRYTLGFIGTYETLSFIQKFFDTKMSYTPDKRTHDIYIIKYAENKTYEILSVLYSSNKAKELGLERKYKKFLEICNIRAIKGSK